ncbi:Hypothetical_protein [Hexamita inflata]|uniref:Hypothetical_protein n=1 Tax=Hexamita inflata TaxID=28002 RepID=A0AA86US18_9EUKA|nr:Hypothetical protein HINF_LOCUS50282 [Hexamita inflata]
MQQLQCSKKYHNQIWKWNNHPDYFILQPIIDVLLQPVACQAPFFWFLFSLSDRMLFGYLQFVHIEVFILVQVIFVSYLSTVCLYSARTTHLECSFHRVLQISTFQVVEASIVIMLLFQRFSLSNSFINLISDNFRCSFERLVFILSI